MMNTTLFNCFSTINEANIHSYAELCKDPILNELFGEALMQHVNHSFVNKIFTMKICDAYQLNMQSFINATSMSTEDLYFEIIGFLIKKFDKLMKAFSTAMSDTDFAENAFNKYILVAATNHIIDLYRKETVEVIYTDTINGVTVTKKGRIPASTHFSECVSLDSKAFVSNDESDTTWSEYISDEAALSIESLGLISNRIFWELKQLSGNNILEFLASSLDYSTDRLAKTAEIYGVPKKNFTLILAHEYLDKYSLLNLNRDEFLDIINSAHYGTGLSKKTLEKEHTEFIKEHTKLNAEYDKI